jgi:hypothetical protein
VGDKYAVDVAAVEAAVSGIQQTVDGVAVTPVKRIAPPVPAVGDQRLAEALSQFCARWDVGVSGLCADAEQLVKRLRESAIGYEAAERTASSSTRGAGGGSGSAVGGR